MHMKHLGLLFLLLLSIPAHALVVSVKGYGNIPADGMEISLSEPEEDILTGDMHYVVTGSLISNTPLTVTITRSAANLEDEFCCAGQCTAGNGEMTEELNFTPGGMADWFVHMAADNGSCDVTYCFSDGTESRTLTVHYIDPTEGIESVTDNPSPATRKVLRNGIIYIETENNIYHL